MQSIYKAKDIIIYNIFSITCILWWGHVALHVIYAKEHKYRVLATCKLSPVVKCQSTNASPFALPPFIWLYALPTPSQYIAIIRAYSSLRLKLT